MIIDCKSIADGLIEGIKKEAQGLKRMPCMKCIMLGNDGGAESYLNMMSKTFARAGFSYEIIRLLEESTTEQLVEIIEGFNGDNTVDAIMVQMPLPRHVDAKRVLFSIAPDKDPDGFHLVNSGRLMTGEAGIRPCTPSAVVHILKEAEFDLAGKNVVVIGRSNIVGKPLGIMLLEENATVTMAHSKTKNLADHTRRADIVVVAVGRPGFLTRDMVTEDTVVVDVGTNNVNGKMVGDADFSEIEPFVRAITPVPGGVGRVTNGFLLKNVLENYKKQI